MCVGYPLAGAGRKNVFFESAFELWEFLCSSVEFRCAGMLISCQIFVDHFEATPCKSWLKNRNPPTHTRTDNQRIYDQRVFVWNYVIKISYSILQRPSRSHKTRRQLRFPFSATPIQESWLPYAYWCIRRGFCHPRGGLCGHIDVMTFAASPCLNPHFLYKYVLLWTVCNVCLNYVHQPQ